jgi:hypothetical protein
MWVQFTGPPLLDHWIHYFFIAPYSLQLVNSLKIRWNHFTYKGHLLLCSKKKQGGCVTLWPCHLHKKVSQDKRRIMKTQIFSPHNIYIYIIFKKSSKETQILHNIINSRTNLSKFQHKRKYVSSFKNPHIKIDFLLLPRGQNPWNYYTL